MNRFVFNENDDTESVEAKLAAGRFATWTSALSKREVAVSFPKLTFTWEPVPDAMEQVAQDAHALGVLEEGPGPVLGIYRLDPLNDVLDDESLPPVEVPG